MDARAQSLAEVARKEAERRERLEQQGVREKVISTEDPARLAPGGSLSTFAPEPRGRSPTKSASPPEKRSPASLRAALQRLDRGIRQAEDRLALLRARVSSERWALPKAGRSKGSGSSGDRLAQQIQELEAKLKHLREQRLETYNNGRKAGFLPGELDGKGITP